MSESSPAEINDDRMPPAKREGILSRLKEKLESPIRGAGAFSSTLHDFLLVTWPVPAERLQGIVPPDLGIDLLPGEDGSLLAFVQVACYFWEDLHWSPLHLATLTEPHHQVVCRVLTRRNNQRGVYNLRTYFSVDEVRNRHRILAKEVDSAQFQVHIAGNPAQGEYISYSLRAVGDRGQTRLEVRFPESGDAAAPPPSPFHSFDDMVQFLSDRREQYFSGPIRSAGLGMIPVQHPPLQPRTGSLESARVSVFTDKKILTPEELLQPLSVLVQPTLPQTTSPVRLILPKKSKSR